MTASTWMNCSIQEQLRGDICVVIEITHVWLCAMSCSCGALNSLWLYLFSVSLESSALMSFAPCTACPTATTEACDTTPGDDDACTDVVPALEAEGGCILAAESQRENRKHIKQPLPIDYEQQHACSDSFSVISVCLSTHPAPSQQLLRPSSMRRSMNNQLLRLS